MSLKFVADRKRATVALDLEHPEEIFNQVLYDQLLSLKKILVLEYLPTVIFEDRFASENGKIIHRIYVNHETKFSIHNKNTWRDCYESFVESMSQFELFFKKYEDYIKSAL